MCCFNSDQNTRTQWIDYVFLLGVLVIHISLFESLVISGGSSLFHIRFVAGVVPSPIMLRTYRQRHSHFGDYQRPGVVINDSARSGNNDRQRALWRRAFHGH
jgi:hypothetical protein